MGMSQEVIAQAEALEPGYPGQVVRIRCQFVDVKWIQTAFEASITAAIRGVFSILPGWTLNNVIYPVVDNVKVCDIIIVRGE